MGISLHRNVYSLDGRVLDATGEQCEFQKNLVFRVWEASGGPRGTRNRWGGLAGAKGKARLIPGHPKEEGFSDSLASPGSLQGER